MKYKVGLALSGGGVKGAVHAGMIHFFDEIGLKPNVIAGTSAGALVGGLYATGATGKEILRFLLEVKPFTLSLWSGKRGLISTTKLKPILLKYYKTDDFKDLKIPFIPSATNMFTGDSDIFDSGSLIDSVLASAAYPGVFDPVEINNTVYCDGGIVNHFPVLDIRSQCEFLIGMHLSPNKELKAEDLATTKNILSRTLDIQGSLAEFKKLELCDIGMLPKELVNYQSFGFEIEKIHKLFDLGYKYAQTNSSKLKNLTNL